MNSAYLEVELLFLKTIKATKLNTALLVQELMLHHSFKEVLVHTIYPLGWDLSQGQWETLWLKSKELRHRLH
jgi:hypothetical protein